MQSTLSQLSSSSMAAQRAAVRRSFTPPTKRSGITRLTTPNLTQSTPPTTNRSMANASSLTPPPTTSTSISSPPPAHTEERLHGDQLDKHESNTVERISSDVVWLSPTPGSSPWRHRVAAVCQRLEHAMQETESILMRLASTSSSSPSFLFTSRCQSPLTVSHSPITDPCVPTPAQTLEAVQRYRSGCMSALLELRALLSQAPTDRTPCPAKAMAAAASSFNTGHHPDNEAYEEQRTQKTLVPMSSANAQAAEVSQLQQKYHLLEARLSEVMAAQGAYMEDVAAKQRQRERDGILGEYMWAARLLVEQEAAERMHLTQLCAYVLSSVDAQTWTTHHDRSRQRRMKNASAGPPRPAPGVSATMQTSTSTADAAVARLTAEREVLQRELSQQGSRTQSLLQAQMRDVQAAHERALAQMVARHEAEKNTWKARLDEAENAVEEQRQRCASLADDLSRSQHQRHEAQLYATITHDGLRMQLQDTTKKMWQLQLANDHLDAKARVLQRELEEMRMSPAPVRNQPSMPTLPQSAAVPQCNEAPLSDEHMRATKPSATSELIGVPSAARMARVATTPKPASAQLPVSSNNSPTSVPCIPRLPDPPRRRTMDDIRHGDALCLSIDNNSCEKAKRDEEEATVNPSVWLAYDERSLASSTAPTKTEGLRYAHHVADAPVSSTSVASVNYAWSDGRHSSTTARHRSFACPSPPVSNNSSVKRTSASAPVSSVFRGDAVGVNVSYMSEGPTTCVSTEARSHMSTSMAAAAGGRSQRSCSHQSPPPQHRSPTQRQLSLDRTPVTAPPQPAHLYIRDEPHPAQQLRHLKPSRPSSDETTSEEGAQSTRSSPLPHTAPLAASTTSSPRAHNNLEMVNDDSLSLPLPAPHGAAGEDCTTTSLQTSSRERLESVLRELRHHTEVLEREVQTSTARHDAAQRQRRRERDIIRANATPLPARSTADAHGGDDDSGNTSDVDRALERLQLAQQDDDIALAQYYAEVNRKREKLEQCRRAVEEKLASLHRGSA
ncbi:hypothetical protein ABL78_4901 [Leptomonas seymouri]|uniref:Uncharacterized protein n=1 Tax=Leptomonas seymouri TaxID=5684 RepID=A0A0N1HXK3_LEPSE|nr:hypothetical protein ABL78_4901 [Leptomonas seymouri]|eukprot:KPI86032.1 hypothetical protein ABL78_4901 [Leptomonas seymouri]